MGYKRVGIEFPEDIWKKAKIKCIENDISFTKYVISLLKQDLEQKKSTCS